MHSATGGRQRRTPRPRSVGGGGGSSRQGAMGAAPGSVARSMMGAVMLTAIAPASVAAP
jgi:hypothetical protein